MSSFLKNIFEKVSKTESEEEELSLADVEDLTEEEREDDLALEEDENFVVEEDETANGSAGEGQESYPQMAVDEQTLRETEERLEDLDSRISKIKATNEDIKEEMSELEEKMQKLYRIYEVVFKGVNPFEEDYDFESDIQEVLDDFISGEGAGGTRELEKKIEELESRLDEMDSEIQSDAEDLISSEESEGFAEEEGDIESDYEEIFKSEEKPGEGEEAKWEVGEKVIGPEGDKLIVVDRQWDSFEGKWQYRCETAGGG